MFHVKHFCNNLINKSRNIQYKKYRFLSIRFELFIFCKMDFLNFYLTLGEV